MAAKFWLCALLLVLSSAPALADRVDELERKVNVLTEEIADLRSGTPADTARPVSRLGLGPAASKVYGGRGVSIGGYGEMLLEKFDREREDDVLSGRRNRLDFLRNVLYVGYKFDDAILFNSEIELEHAGVKDEAEVDGSTAELSGEVVLEFAYVDWRMHPLLGARAGLLLVPIGIVNEMHEPVTFMPARRPEVERNILPATWSANGIGVYGETENGLSWRAYLMEGLNGESFSASGIRGGRQSGSQSLVTKPALAARADWSGFPGLAFGASMFHGDTWQELQTGPTLSPTLTLWDAHARLDWRGLELRGLFAEGRLTESGELSTALGLPAGEWIGSRNQGAYVEGAYDLLAAMSPGSRFRLLPYARFERFDPQVDAEDGLNEPALETRIFTAGLAFQPHPGVIVKLDRQQRSNQAETETSQWNAAVGYTF